jgi:DUF438 domain-containing protein
LFISIRDASGRIVSCIEIVRNINERKRVENSLQESEEKFLRKDGTYLWALLSENPLYDKNGNYIGALAMVTDITERKRMETGARKSGNFILIIGRLL